MSRQYRSAGSSNSLYVMALGSVMLICVLGYLLFRGGGGKPSGTANVPTNTTASSSGDTDSGSEELLLYCAAGMRYPLEEITSRYEEEYGVRVNLQYGGSNTLLSQLEINKTGDLYLAGDASYIRLAEEKGLTLEAFPLALMKPVVAIKAGNPKGIKTINDLLRDDVKVALGDPTAAAVGKKTRRLLSASGHWAELEQRVTVYKPTVNEVANAVELGSVDAGIIWDSTVVQYKQLDAVAVPELDAGLANIEVGVTTFTKSPTSAIRFARFLAARDKGLEVFRAKGFEPVDGDVWEERPQITFFAGAVNREALQPIIDEFEQREGVEVNAVFNGCGTLTSSMRSILGGKPGTFPDVYMACDVYYLEVVDELFQDAVNVSDTDIVIVTQQGNPKGIKSLSDLAKPDVRVVLGQPEKCTIGVLSRRLLQSEGVYDKLVASGNLVNETMSSALLIPQVATGAADVVLAYRTDTRAEGSRFDVIDIDSQLAKAIQPFSIARSSDHKYLGRRLFAKLAASRDKFESNGFNWRLDGPPSGTDQRSTTSTSNEAQ